MFTRYVVLRHIRNNLRPVRRVHEFVAMTDRGWRFSATDLDGRKNDHYGYLKVFSREDAARRHFESCRGMDGEHSSAQLYFCKSLTRRGAARMALTSIEWEMSGATGELLDSHYGKKSGEEP